MRRLPYYKLDEAGDPVPCASVLEWATWFAENDEARVVARTELPSGCVVSTVFLGVDHNFVHEGDPVLWETMMFGSEYDLACDRYRSKKDAIVGHEMWILVAKGEMTPIDARRLRTPITDLIGDSQARQTHEAPTKPKKEQA